MARHLVRLTSYALWDNGHEDNRPSTVSVVSLTWGTLRQRCRRLRQSLSQGSQAKRNGMYRYRFYASRRHPRLGSFDTSELIKSERISRCKALRLLRLTVAFVVATTAGVVISASTAGAGDASGYVRHASCTLVRYYVAKYSAPAAEAWARSKGATDAEINTARRCILPQKTAQVGHAADRAF